MMTHHREGEQGTLEAVPRLRRQHVVATCTPCTNACTVAVYKPARLPSIEIPIPDDWFYFFAACGSDFEFVIECLSLLAVRLSSRLARLSCPAEPTGGGLLGYTTHKRLKSLAQLNRKMIQS